MTRPLKLLVPLVVLAVAAPAAAQVKVRDHRKKRRAALEVDRWSPKSGPVGTEVTLYGKGFGKKTTVLFGGRRVRPTERTGSRLSFRVPRRYGDAEIVLRTPGRSGEVKVGTFRVQSPPVVRRFAPSSGVYGTRVEIWGAAFEKDDRVLMDGRPLRVLRRSARRLVVEIPDWAETGYLWVSREDGTRARTARKFRVLRPAPRITDMQPSSGPPGASVRLEGEGFSDRDQVWYGRNRVAVTRRGDGWIDVVVPQSADHSRYFRIRGPGGESRSPQAYQLESPPSIESFSPEAGSWGGRVDLYGQNFRAGDRVRLGGRWLKILQLRPKQITVRLPRGVQTGSFVLVRDRTRVTAPRRFEVGQAPQITSWTPQHGGPGTEVTLSGRDLARAEVYYGEQRARVLRRDGDHRLVVRVPRRADQSHRFKVETRYGSARTGRPFEVRSYPDWASVRPRRGAPGTRITVRGRDLRRVSAVYLGGVECPIVKRTPRLLQVEVPKEARSGQLSWAAYGERQDTRWDFQVITPPEITGTSPGSAYPGEEIVIEGRGFDRNARAYFGRQRLRIKRWKPGRLWVELPRRASGSDYLWIEGEGGKVRSPRKLSIGSPPELGSYSPRRGKPGTRVTIRGKWFTPTTDILVGKTPAPIVDRKGDRLLVIQIPEVGAGSEYLWVQDGSHRDRSRRPFQVEGYASMSRFRPDRVEAGDTVMIWGENLSDSVRVYFGDRRLRITRTDRRGQRLWVEIPKRLRGTDWLYLEDGGRKERSSEKLQVVGERPKDVKVRDHRRR